LFTHKKVRKRFVPSPAPPVAKSVFHLSRKGFAVFLLAAVPLCLCLVWLAVRFAEQRLAADMAATARDRLIVPLWEG
jgi:hypothetical protein